MIGPVSRKKTPTGRTLRYRLLRICERFGQSPEYLNTLDRQAKIELLAFEDIRTEEEIDLACIAIPRKE